MIEETARTSALIALATNHYTILHWQSKVDALVKKARGAGATWEQIGFTVGISKQAAHQAWGNQEEPEIGLKPTLPENFELPG